MFYKSYKVKLEINSNGKFTYMWNFNDMRLKENLKA